MGLCIAAFLTSFVFSTKVRAACGLEYCPVELSPNTDSSSNMVFELPVQINVAGFNLKAGQGHYVETATGLVAEISANILVGATLGWIVLERNDHQETGPGNPMAFLQYNLELPSRALKLAIGSQLEFPMSSSPATIASSHFEVLPYFSARYQYDSFFSSLRAGGRFALESLGHGDGHSHHHDHHHAPFADAHGLDAANIQFVNAHHDAELLVWWNLGAHLTQALQASAFVNSKASMSQDTRGDTYITAGLSTTVQAHDVVDIYLAAEFPLTEFRWFDWRSTLKTSVAF